jgi:integral membrane protein (TIGR01906 family)
MPRKTLTHYLGYMLAGLFILCIPIFLITSNLRWAVNDVRLYEYGFNKYAVSEETGFSDEELLEVAQGLIRYIDTGQQGSEFEIFNDRELVHLEDVRDLVLVNYRLQEATLGFLLLFTIVGVIWQRKRFAFFLARILVRGSIFTIALLAALGVVALINFRWLFNAFHHLFFSGDSWILAGYLPRIFTEGFFSDAALFVIGAIVIETLIIGGLGGYVVIRSRRAGNYPPVPQVAQLGAEQLPQVSPAIEVDSPPAPLDKAVKEENSFLAEA